MSKSIVRLLPALHDDYKHVHDSQNAQFTSFTRRKSNKDMMLDSLHLR